ncbi:DUF2293 domain-containing protein, partial [Streptomyces sp. NPDC001155]
DCGTTRSGVQRIRRHRQAAGGRPKPPARTPGLLSEGAVISAVVAAVRHVDTPYDELLMSGVSRYEARRRIAPAVESVLRAWQDAGADAG